jgi:hypothetical protein
MNKAITLQANDQIILNFNNKGLLVDFPLYTFVPALKVIIHLGIY